MLKTMYVLITAARNEDAYIENTIQSVISQALLPQKWIVVSDGSADRTDEITSKYAEKHDFIQLLRREPNISRNFASKVNAIRTGLKQLNGIEYDFIGNLDADISFEPTYYESVIAKFHDNPKLGIAGGILLENCGGKYIRGLNSMSSSVWGSIQMFRRQCYEDIGGYMPLKRGGVDAIAEIKARMNGWETITFPDIKVLHHRRSGTEKEHILFARFRQGIMEYSHGYHPIFELAKCVSRIREKPYVFGSFFRLCGYFFAQLQRECQVLHDEELKYLRREQIKRLYDIFK